MISGRKLMDANVLLIVDLFNGWMDSLDILPIQRKREERCWQASAHQLTWGGE
jgi:hypothetical protein